MNLLLFQTKFTSLSDALTEFSAFNARDDGPAYVAVRTR